jgi:hypothetical protein
MSFAEVFEELTALSLAQRQELIARAIQLDDVGLSASPESSVPFRSMKKHLQSLVGR